jgi:hypothetical protein
MKYPYAIAVVLGLSVLALSTRALWAGEADVVDARATRSASNTYTFHVTVQHEDTGWDHYADKWNIMGPDGTVLGTRVLLHPHVAEQPFTRSLTGVQIPSDTKSITVRAHDKVHGWGGQTMTVQLP